MGYMRGWFKKILSEAGEPRAKCRQCGVCCEMYSWHLKATDSDLARWRAEGRVDLLSMVNRLGWIWVDPDSGERIDRCPFIEKDPDDLVFCGIHETKPKVCRDYPTLSHDNRCVMS